MNRFDIINRIGDKYRVGNTETGEFSYAQALKTVGKDIKDYQKATTGTQHKFLDIRFEWNQYQFETYAPMITGRTPIPNGKQTSYERNRNLFYVCCSRPRKRLFFFVSVPIDASFRVFLDDLVGAENIYTYGQYLEAKQ